MIFAHHIMIASDLRMLDQAIDADYFTCLDRSHVQRFTIDSRPAWPNILHIDSGALLAATAPLL